MVEWLEKAPKDAEDDAERFTIMRERLAYRAEKLRQAFTEDADKRGGAGE